MQDAESLISRESCDHMAECDRKRQDNVVSLRRPISSQPTNFTSHLNQQVKLVFVLIAPFIPRKNWFIA